MPGATNHYREQLNHALTEHERDLVLWLIEHSFIQDASRLLPQVDRLSVISKCTCGCPTIDFTLDGQPAPATRKGESFISDWLADVNGMPVYVQLWMLDDQISSLEVGSLPGTNQPFGLPAIGSIHGY